MMFKCHYSHIIITGGSLKPQYTGPLGSRGKGIRPGKSRGTVNRGFTVEARDGHIYIQLLKHWLGFRQRHNFWFLSLKSRYL